MIGENKTPGLAVKPCVTRRWPLLFEVSWLLALVLVAFGIVTVVCALSLILFWSFSSFHL